MPIFEKHCAESCTLFGEPFPEVHQWLDAFAGTPQYGFKHRRKRHHAVGVEEVRKMFGDKAAAAARQHIISDLKLEGWTDKDPFPKDEQHYVRMGLF